MTTSSTMGAPPTLTLLRQDYDCPTWCERADHVRGDSEPAIHYGPEFPDGPILVAVQGPAGGPLEAGIYAEGDVFISDLQQLRALAAELLKAAEWLEAHA